MIKFIFFVGRILIDEKNFYSFIDSRLLYLLNQFGAKIDYRNYFAIKDDIIKNRKLSKDSVEELVTQICMVLMPKGYEKMILRYILPSIEFAEKHLLYPYDDTMATIETLAKNFRIGIIGSHEDDYSKILKTYGVGRYINCCVLSYKENNEEGLKILQQKIRNWCEKQNLQKLAVVWIPSPVDEETAGVYKINPKAENTVFVYKKRQIAAKWVNIDYSDISLMNILQQF